MSATPKIVITGTGRAGTTLLVQLLTRMGEDTGFKDETSECYFEKARAGLEWHLTDHPNLPRIIKGPHFCDQIDTMLSMGIAVDHVIIPLRDFKTAAASRRFVQQVTTGADHGWAAPGGLWGTENGFDQEAVIRQKFTTLMEAVVRNNIPTTFIAFPRMTKDPQYLFDKLQVVMPAIERETFDAAFKATVRTDLIHENFDEAKVDAMAVVGELTGRPINIRYAPPRASVVQRYMKQLAESGYAYPVAD